jgi:uncharacterized protein (DUF433 family)
MNMEIINHIKMRDGQAVIRGHGHLKAKMVARKHVWEGLSIEAVMEHYGLTASEVHSAIAYYYDNQEKLDAEYERAVAESRENALTLDKLKTRIADREQGEA